MWKSINRRVRTVAIAALLTSAPSILSVPGPALAADSAEGTTETLTTAEAASLAAAGYGDGIHRAEVMTRAKDWYNRNVPYNQSATAWDVNHGKRYRTDCSGYVSMAWKLPTSLTTSTLDNVSHVINWNDLLPGDSLLYPGHHVQIFDKWNNPDTKAAFWIYEEGSTDTDMNYRKVDVQAERGNEKDGFKYHPYRYNGIRS
jgi:hypothetical protein